MVESESLMLRLWQADAKGNTAAETRGGIWCPLTRLRPRREHGEQRVSAGDERNRRQPVRIDALRTGNDDGVADLNIGNCNYRQSFEHIVDVEARTATRPAGPTRSRTTRSLRSRSGLCLSLTLSLALLSLLALKSGVDAPVVALGR